MKYFSTIINDSRVERVEVSNGGRMMKCYVVLPYMKKSNKKMVVIAGRNESGMEHVSASYINRVPSWEEMCVIKDIFFDEEEECYQIHPKKSEYVNLMPYCLHIWRPVNGKTIDDAAAMK